MAVPVGPNLSHGKFEDVGDLAFWNAINAALGTERHSGNSSLKVVSNGVAGEFCSEKAGTATPISSYPDATRTVMVGAWVKAFSAGLTMELRAQEYSAGPVFVKDAVIGFTSTGDWQYLEVTLVGVGVNSVVRPACHITQVHPAGQNLFVDDVWVAVAADDNVTVPAGAITKDPRQFYANALGIPVGINSLSDLEYQFYSNASRLVPISKYSRIDHEYDYYALKLGLPLGPVAGFSVDDLREAYYKSLGVSNQAGFEQGTMKIRRNLCTKPSFENGVISNFLIVAGTGGAAANSLVSTGALFGTNLMRSTWTVVNTSPGGMDTDTTIAVAPGGAAPGGSVALSCYVKPSVTQNMQLQIIHNAVGGQVNPSIPCTAGAWTRITSTATSSASGAIGWRVRSVGGTLQNPGDTIDYDGFLAETGGITLGTFFDGNSPGARWEGAVNASVSQLATWTP